jgi:hypothetical protein
MENHFTESAAPSLLVHFRESLHRISRESLLSEKLFGRALRADSLLNPARAPMAMRERERESAQILLTPQSECRQRRYSDRIGNSV